MIKILSIISLSFVLLLTHIHISFAEPVACAVSTDPCGEGSSRTRDINNICAESHKDNNKKQDKDKNTIHESKTIAVSVINPKTISNFKVSSFTYCRW